MPTPFFAHSANRVNAWHPLAEHLLSVGQKAREFSAAQGWADEAGLAGLLHDLGKYGNRFQARLHGNDHGLDHWSQGAWVALSASIYESGGVVGAVCHGPAGLVNLKLSNGEYLVRGKRVAAFTDDEERAVNLAGVVPFLLAATLQERGAIHVPAPNWQANVIVDGRLVTGQNPASAEGVGREMVRVIIESESVKNARKETA